MKTIGSKGKKVNRGPKIVCIKMQGQIVDMELDTCSDRTLISAKKFFAMGDRIPVQETNLRLQTFTGEQTEAAGEATGVIKFWAPRKRVPYPLLI